MSNLRVNRFGLGLVICGYFAICPTAFGQANILIRVSRLAAGQNISSGQGNVPTDATPTVINLVGNVPAGGGESVTVTITNLGAINCPGGLDGVGSACTPGAATRFNITTGPVLGFALGDELQIAALPGQEICNCTIAAGYTLFRCCSGNIFSTKGGFLGNNTHHIDVLPPPAAGTTGRCCVGAPPNSVCAITSASECADLAIEGTYGGDGTVCSQDACSAPIPTVSEWGLITLTLLLLIAATLLFARGRRMVPTISEI